MAEEQEQILNIRVNYSEAVRGITEYESKIAELKQRLIDLDEAQAKGDISTKEYAEAVAVAKNQINVYSGEIRTLNKEIQNNIKVEEAQEGSLKQLRAQLSNLTKEYDSLSKSERESGERGRELREAINKTTTEIKSAEEATQRYYRNVGNYENAIKNTLGTQSKWFQQLQMIRDAMSGGVVNGLKMAGSAVMDFGKQLLALLANPIVATIAAIAAAFMALKKGIESSEQNTRALQVILAPFKRALEGLLSILQNVTTTILNAVQGAENLAMGMSKLAERLPVVGRYFQDINRAVEENIQLERERQKIEDETRRVQVLSAKTARDVAILRAAAAKTDDPKQRAKFLQTAIDLEEKEMRLQKDLAVRRYENAKAQAAHTQNTKEANEELAQLEAAMYQAESNYYQGTLRMRSQLHSAEKESIRIKKENVEVTNISIEAARKEEAAIRQATDAFIALIKDRVERERATITENYNRQIADLIQRLNTEKDLTERTRVEINNTIIALGQQRNQALADLEAKASQEAIQKAVATEEERLRLIIETTKKGSEEQLNARMELLRQQQDAAIMEVEQSELTETQKQERITLIAKSYEQQRTDLLNQQQQAELNALQSAFEQRIQQETDNALVQQQLRVEQKRAELEALHQVEGESEEAYNARRLQLTAEYNAANKKLVEENNKVEQSRLAVMSAVVGGLSSILDSFGDDNKAAAVASKVLALAEVAINTGKAISAGVASAMSTPFPANIGAVATTIATIMANITTAIKTINSAKFADGGVAEVGGNVRGTGTSKSDSIPAHLSNGESVMTAAATAMFAPMLSTMNQIGGGVPIASTGTIYTSNSGDANGMELISNAVSAALRDMPNPIVSVEEINNTTNRVMVIESMAEARVTQ